MTGGQSILAELLGDTSLADFLNRYYLKLPFARCGGCAGITSCADSSILERLLVHPEADVLVGRLGTRHPGPPPQSRSAAEALLAEGFTIGIRKADRIDSGLREIAAQFAAAFKAPIDVHLYCTPASQPGFGWHYDSEEVFVLQTSGAKDWYLQKNTVHPWPLMEAIPDNQRHEREIMPVQHCRLTEGDWLYTPGGYWHRTSAVTQSTSLSVGIQAPTALDFFDFLRPQLIDSILWRQRLPPLDHSTVTEVSLSAWRQLLQPLIEDLSSVMATDYSIQTFLEHQLKARQVQE